MKRVRLGGLEALALGIGRKVKSSGYSVNNDSALFDGRRVKRQRRRFKERMKRG